MNRFAMISSQNEDPVKLIGIPNSLTLVRLLICPIFFLFYLKPGLLNISAHSLPFVLLALLTVLELSDAFDGYIARKYGQVTEFGKLFDPMADSIARISVFLAMTEVPVRLPVIFVFIFVYRDSVISSLRSLCALKGVVLAAKSAGKIKAIIQACASFAIVLAMIPHAYGIISQGTLWWIAVISVGIAAAQSIYSGVLYLVENRAVLWKAMTLKSS